MKVLLVVFVLGLFSCGSETAVPKGVLQPPQMSKILWDVIRSDEAANHQYRQDTANSLFRQSTALYRSVFQLHQVSDSQFKQSFRYYQAHPAQMKVLLDSVDALAKQPILDTIKKVTLQ